MKDGRDGQMGNTALGEGEAGFAATIAVLQDHHFEGSLISENDYSGAAAVRAARDIALLTGQFPVVA